MRSNNFSTWLLEALRFSLPTGVYAPQMESLIAFFNSCARVSLLVSRSSSKARRRSRPRSRAARSLRAGMADACFRRLGFAIAKLLIISRV